ncbi:radical SAM protein, partial [Candidatus Poribacteria bacterium]
MKVREVTCKSILTKSGISDYSLNPYFGCQHSCVYCYARYLLKYRPHEEAWGEFVDVKVNAPRVLQKEVLRRKPGGVFISSACDAYQPLEEEIELTRRLLRILSETDFQIRILTKSALVRRDVDLLSRAKRRAAVGVTVTTMDERLRKLIEPNASPSKLR